MVGETKAQKVGFKWAITNFNLGRYFFSRDLEGMPKEPTLLAVRRALWYSFGSIAYGSLASSIMQFLHQASSISRENSFYEGFPRVIYVIEWPGNWLLKFFNVKASPSLQNLVPEPISLTRTALRLFTHGFRQPGVHHERKEDFETAKGT